MHALKRAVLALWLAGILVGCGDGGSGDNPLAHALDAAADDTGKVAGANLDVSRRPTEAALDDLVAAGVDWVALIPFGWQPRWDAPRVTVRTTGVRWGETDEGLREIVARARERGIRTLIKPHIWLIDEVPTRSWRRTPGPTCSALASSCTAPCATDRRSG